MKDSIEALYEAAIRDLFQRLADAGDAQDKRDLTAAIHNLKTAFREGFGSDADDVLQRLAEESLRRVSNNKPQSNE